MLSGFPGDGQVGPVGGSRLRDAGFVYAERVVAADFGRYVSPEVHARHGDRLRVGVADVARQCDFLRQHLDGGLAGGTQDILDAGQSVNLAVAEVGGVGTRGGEGVVDGRLLHDLLHVVHGQVLVLGILVERGLQPEGHDAGCRGRGHRRAFHHGVGVG